MKHRYSLFWLLLTAEIKKKKNSFQGITSVVSVINTWEIDISARGSSKASLTIG